MPTTKLNAKRIKLLNKELSRNRGLKSCESYLQIELKKDSTTEYELVRRAGDTSEIWPGFVENNRPEGVAYKSDAISRDLEYRNVLNETGLNLKKQKAQKQMQWELDAANRELYYKDMGTRPYLKLSTPQELFLIALAALSIPAYIVAALFAPPILAFPVLAIFLATVLSIQGYLISPFNLIDRFMKKRFDKKEQTEEGQKKKAESNELKTELDQLLDTYCVKQKITVPAVSNEDILFDKGMPSEVRWAKGTSNEDELFAAPLPKSASTISPVVKVEPVEESIVESALSKAPSEPKPAVTTAPLAFNFNPLTPGALVMATGGAHKLNEKKEEVEAENAPAMKRSSSVVSLD